MKENEAKVMIFKYTYFHNFFLLVAIVLFYIQAQYHSLLIIVLRPLWLRVKDGSYG